MSMITAVVAAFDASTKHLRGTVLSPVRFGRPRRCGDGPMMRGCMAMRWCVAVRGCVPRQYEAVGQ